MKNLAAIGVCGVCVGMMTVGGQASAQTVQTIGSGSAVSVVDRGADFGPLAVNGTPISDYTENGMFIGVDGDSWVGSGLPLFDPFHGANGSDRAFYFPFGGSPGWVTIYATDGKKIHGLEFLYGNGWTTGDIYGVPWGNNNAIVQWQTWNGNTMVSSGVIGDVGQLSVGTVVGFHDAAGFDRLLVKCTIATSADPNLQALAMDQLRVQLRACAADFNGSGAVSVQDIFDFLAAYFAGSSSADFNQSGVISVQDIFDYLGAYFAGCS